MNVSGSAVKKACKCKMRGHSKCLFSNLTPHWFYWALVWKTDWTPFKIRNAKTSSALESADSHFELIKLLHNAKVTQHGWDCCLVHVVWLFERFISRCSRDMCEVLCSDQSFPMKGSNMKLPTVALVMGLTITKINRQSCTALNCFSALKWRSEASTIILSSLHAYTQAQHI